MCVELKRDQSWAAVCVVDLGLGVKPRVFSLSSSDADTPDKASVTTTAVEGKGKVNGATATSVGNETGCFRCAIVPQTKGGEGLYGDI